MKCRLVVRLEASPSAQEPPGTWYEAGYVIDNPRAYMLVQNGCAEPADEECQKACGMSVEARIIAQQTYHEFNVRIREEGTEPDDDAETFDDPEYL